MRNQVSGPVVNVNTISSIVNDVTLSQPHQSLMVFTTHPVMTTTSFPTINVSTSSMPAPASSEPYQTPTSTATTSMPTTFQSPTSSSSGKGRKVGVKNWSDLNTSVLLTLIDKHLPRGSDEWNNVASEYVRTTKVTMMGCVCTYVCVWVCMYVLCVHLCMCVCVCVCVYLEVRIVCTCTCTGYS